MREQWERLASTASPYGDELRVVVSIVAIVLFAVLLRNLGWRLIAPFFGRITQRAATVEEHRRLETVGQGGLGRGAQLAPQRAVVGTARAAQAPEAHLRARRRAGGCFGDIGRPSRRGQGRARGRRRHHAPDAGPLMTGAVATEDSTGRYR